MKTKSLLTRFILACIVLVAIIFCGCESKEEIKQRAEQKANDIFITEYDSCEYLTFRTYAVALLFTLTKVTVNFV